MHRPIPPTVLVTGSKDSGKTSLVVRLIARLTQRGHTVYACKRASEVHSVTESGTDTARFAEAGAAAIGLTWPDGTYVHSGRGAAPTKPGQGVAPAFRRLDRPSGLDDMFRLMATLVPLREDSIMLAEGFSDTDYPRVHVLPRPGRPGRPAGGPVLATWSLDPPHEDPDNVADLVEANLGLVARWTSAAWVSNLMPAAVLAGGRGRRLGGIDKWSLDVGGTPQGARCLGAVQDVFARVMVTGRSALPASWAGPKPRGRLGGRRQPRRPAPARLEWLPDAAPGSGPLGGLLTAFEASPGSSLFALAGDMPFLSPALMRHMLFTAARFEGKFDAFVPRWGGFSEPLHAIYGPACHARLRTMLEPAAAPLVGHRVTDLLDGLRVKEVGDEEVRLFGDPRVLFLNLNTPKDLARARAVARGPG